MLRPLCALWTIIEVRNGRVMFKVMTIFGVILVWLLRMTLAWADTEQSQVLQQAIALFHAKRYSESQTLLARLVDAHPENATVHYYLGRIYLQVQAYDKAIAHCTRAAILQATEAEHHFCLGLSYGQKARQAPFWQQALLAPKIRKALEKTVSLDPAHVPARIGLSRFYLQAPTLLGGDLNKAYEQAEVLLRLDASAGHDLINKIEAARGSVPATN
jgi:tetratricopeptide (TPR) repeat protein